MTTSASAVVASLRRFGVRRVYTVPGESYLSLLDEVARARDLELVSTRHEAGAAFMADAEAKLTGRPAVALASRGPGAANLAIGVHTARQDSTPMLVLLGQVPRDLRHREAFQEVDLAGLYSTLAKRASEPATPAGLVRAVEDGLRLSLVGRPGPVAVVVPADLLGAELGSSDWPGCGEIDAGPSAGVRGGVESGGLLDSATVTRLAAELDSARRPVVVAGSGLRHAVPALVAMAERWQVGVYAAFRRQDVFPNDHPLYLGHLGLGTPAEVLEPLEQADVVLALGTRFSEVTSQSYRLPTASSRVHQVDVDPEVRRVGGPGGSLVVVDAARVAAALAAWPGQSSPRPEVATAHARWAATHTPPAGGTPAGGLRSGVHPARAVAAMEAVLPPGAIVTNDAGNFAAFLHRYYSYRQPLTQLAPTSGAMGYGVPAAVAAALVEPARPVVAVVGDGGLLMTGQEIETAARYGLDITVVCLRNGLYGTIATHQELTFGRRAGVEIGPVDLAGWARALGAEAWTAAEDDAVAPALAAAVAVEGPSFVEVVTDPDILSPTVTRHGSRA